ncbi:MAG: glycosyltransferase family 9 protein [Planctomycetia bacterium]|nr:glycosyltransferase family 9 protein [Planctomycetia bacterium]
MAPRILIVKLSSLGDVLHTLPAARMLREAFPDAHLGWAVERAHSGLLAGQPCLDALHLWNRGASRGFRQFIGELRAGHWDVAIDFQGLLRSAWIARLSGARQVIGHAPTKERAHWLYHRRVPPATMERHAVDRSLDLAAAVVERLSGQTLSRPATRAEFTLYPSVADQHTVDAWWKAQNIRDRERLVLLNPHCRKDANRWPVERFTALARNLTNQPGVRVALVGGAVARDVCDAIAAPLGDRIARADGAMGLLASAELIRRADAFVTGDTGPMHIAAAVGTPIVALFGPANPLRTGPYTDRAKVIYKKLSCSPCYARDRCPLGHAVPACMAEISVGEVQSAVMAALAESATNPRDFLRRSA